MADIKLRIEVNPNGETTLGAGDGKEKLGTIVNKTNDTGTNSNLSNTSFKAKYDGVFENLPDKRVNGSNGLSMASDDGSDAYDFIFNDSDELDNVDSNGAIVEDEQNPSEFIWGIVPSNKQYSVKLTFTNATSLKDIVIYGDTEVGQFPTKAIIDGTRTIYSDDAKWAINMQAEKATHTIEFLEWNRANYNACISNIRVMLRYFDLDRGWIDSVESLSQTTSDPSSIQYGVLANSGSANLRDVDGELKDLIVDEVIPNSNVPVELFVNGNKVQCHITTDSDYVEEDKMLNLNLENRLKFLDTLKFQGAPYQETQSAYSLLSYVLSGLGYISDSIETWTMYQNADDFDMAYGTDIRIENTSNNWAIIGLPLTVVKDKEYKISFKYLNWLAYQARTGYSGIACQILSALPTNSDCSDISITTIQLSNLDTADKEASISFIAPSELVYFVFNFGYVAQNQNIILSLSNFSINDKSTTDVTSREIVYGKENSFGTIKQYLESISVEYAYLEKSSFREALEKICSLAQLELIMDENDHIKLVGGRPIANRWELSDAIKLPKSHLISNVQKSIVLKNKYDAIDIDEQNGYFKMGNNIGNANSITYYDAQQNIKGELILIDKTADIPEYYNYTSTTITPVVASIDPKTYGEITLTFDFDEIYIKNAKLEFSPTYYVKKESGGDWETLTMPKFVITIPKPSSRPSDMEPISTTYPYTPRYYTEQIIDNKKIIIHISSWIYGQVDLDRGYKTIALSSATYNLIADTLTFDTISANTPNVETSTHVASLSSSEIQQVGTTRNIGDENMTSEIKKNVLSDYANGVSNATVDTFCGDFYNANGDKIIDWSKGEIVRPYDIVYFEGDTKADGSQRYWRVTGRHFKYSGSPTVSLELQEIAKIY